MTEAIRVLVVEDSEDDAALLLRELTRAGYEPRHERVWSEELLEASLAHKTWDLVISDHSLPGFTGTDALRIVRAREPNLPFIFVSGSIGEETAVAAMRAGAQDYVMKGNTKRLIPAIRRTLGESEARQRERATEEQLRSAGELIRSVFAASPLAIIATDLSGAVTLWNPAAERLFGWTHDEVVGKQNPVVPVQVRETIEARRAMAAQGEVISDVEASRLRKDGSEVNVSVTVAATYDSARQPDGVTVVYQDMTERKQLQAQFLQAQKMEAVGRLAGGVAHDFNNLLTVITSYTELLRESVKEDDVRRQDLDAIRHAAEAATALTKQLLSFSRQRVIEQRVVELREVVAGASKLATRLLGASIEVVEELDRTTGLVRLDPGHVEQIVMNLLVNARDAMPKGGKIFITTRHVDTIEVHAGDGVVPSATGYALLSVRDTGTGMDAATQARIFEPFFTTKSTDRGTGLGLATVYGLVKQYEGTVNVRSQPGEGTTFDIYLPASGSARASKAPAARGARTAVVGTILIVDDEPSVRTAARRVLERAGYDVLEAPDGQTALRIAEHMEINLLLTDVGLPAMDGRQLAERMQSKRSETNVLFSSGYELDAEDLGDSRHARSGFLKKPYTPDALLRAVDDLLK